MSNIQTIISAINAQISDLTFIAKHKVGASAFSRNRKIAPFDIVLFVLSLVKTTLTFEVERYFDCVGKPSVWPGSMTKARSKLSFTAFYELLINTVAMIEPKRDINGYRLIAFDGTQGELIRTPEILQKYPPQEGSRVPMFHAISAYDILSKLFLDAEFLPAPADERQAAITLIERMPLGNSDILLFDRGFPSVKLLHALDQKGVNYVMRVSKSFLTEVNRFTESEQVDSVITVDYDEKRAKSSGADCDAPLVLKFRCVKIQLPSGETEVLLTSLLDPSLEDIYALYGRRWGIETSYNYLKNVSQIENFVGTLENSVKQEFYGALLVSNIEAIICDEAEQELYKKL